MKENILKYKAYLLIIPIFIIASIVIYSVTKENNDDKVILEPTIEEVKEEVKTEEIETIRVDVKGEVNNPGVYELNVGKRVADAIEKSGGITENADTSLINLSKNLKDEMVIVVYNKNEIEKLRQELTTTKTVIEYIEKECSCPDTVNDACISKAQPETKKDATTSGETTNTLNGKVNINTATKEELMTVSGIGETKADAIVKYRTEKGLFNDINEITNVSGIGTSTFDKIKDYITI